MPSYISLMQLIHSFEAYLGNPETQNTPVNFEHSLIFDEQESLAWPQIKFIQEWGVMEYLIPCALGGKLDSLDSTYALVKSISRRDLTTAVAVGLSFLGALPLWLAGNIKQQQKIVALFRRGEIVAFALTEEEHGSDIMANEVVAKAYDDGWQLSGKKWCVNFATLGHAVSILCRTHDKGGPLGFSVFLLDKSAVESGFTPTPKLPTFGVRGLDISGFSLNKVFLSQDALVGIEKQGLEITYKILQVSRTLCASFSVGGADTALRHALSFSLKRELYGKIAYDIPVVKQRLGEQFTQLLIADCMGLAIARAGSVMPKKLSFWSAIIKFLIPKMTEDIVEECGLVLGARAYLRTTEWAMFQKIRRDIKVVGLFDGSSQVNLSLIASSLLPQARMRGGCPEKQLMQLEQIFDLKKGCPVFNITDLGLFMHEEDSILAGLSILQSEQLAPLIIAIRHEIDRLDQQIIHLHEQKQLEPRSLAAFRLAEQYCWIFAASCCLHFWHFNQEVLCKESLDLNWIQLAIQLILNKLHANSKIDTKLQESMAKKLVVFYQQNKLFSVLPAQIPD
ncbi:acyl-CoA dehydrogenase [Legionella longbeachae]|uniref:Putative acyl-CoA dehydrogenase n=1 Tax=Legionella longbeachae serogroup 1 (strain NSW150) TaxID=661367 RepID=D3HKR2_LEGLN|nr:acyl-CoA dehydrogenase [Legionella longbeachae]VEE03542.1 acyl-CoA dehydrogenase [Legionella oakridgensis]ARB93571.1 acyl-CoA dehydrogenase [Legionella longbeachae]ARM33292.1 acyl-CoA dehydrogenase [Legionella longbeachae]EEZ93842.1 putative acyl-CoA dehydrogenase [Legionella longbeachae D-4968]QIN33243.1 acyl-CoA dehydrogenase [Legionella longbeachae]